MIDPVPGALPEVTPPAVAPDAGKPKGPEEEAKFAHQLKDLVVKEQQELSTSEKVKEEEREKKEKKKKEERRRNEKLEQDVQITQDNLSKKKEEKDGARKGTHIDIKA